LLHVGGGAFLALFPVEVELETVCFGISAFTMHASVEDFVNNIEASQESIRQQIV